MGIEKVETQELTVFIKSQTFFLNKFSHCCKSMVNLQSFYKVYFDNFYQCSCFSGRINFQ